MFLYILPLLSLAACQLVSETQQIMAHTVQKVHMLKSQLQHSDLYSLKLQQQAELVNQVNRHQAMWKAQLNPSVGLIHKEILSELIQFTEPTRHNPELRLNVVELFGPGPIYDTDTLPSNFDPSDQWPACRFLRKPTVDQAGCGACGVVSAVSSFTDRFCIATNGSVNNGFSSYNALTCGETANFNKELQSCVAGSSPRLAFQDIVDRGLTTEQCQPWPFRPDCGTPCPPHEFVLNQAAPCNDKCDGSDEKATVYKGKVAYTVTDLSSDPHPNDIQHATALIQRELMERGPVAACFKVFEDFLHYKSGVYAHTTGEQVYLHCVRLIGWGLDQVTGLPYWLAANSWGTEWGENGFFRILRGENQCGIEAEVEAIEI